MEVLHCSASKAVVRLKYAMENFFNFYLAATYMCQDNNDAMPQLMSLKLNLAKLLCGGCLVSALGLVGPGL